METRFETEEQQIEALKRWWAANGRAVIMGLLLGLTALVATRYWYQHVQQQAVTASMEFEQLRRELGAKQFDAVNQRADYLRQHFANSPYAIMAALVQARLAVDKSALDDATGHLRWILEQEPMPEYRDVARLRLARLLFAQGQSDAALGQLKVEAGALQPRYEELRGDIMLSQGKREAARAAYERALALLPEAADRHYLEMKLTDLGERTP